MVGAPQPRGPCRDGWAQEPQDREAKAHTAEPAPAPRTPEYRKLDTSFPLHAGVFGHEDEPQGRSAGGGTAMLSTTPPPLPSLLSLSYQHETFLPVRRGSQSGMRTPSSPLARSMHRDHAELSPQNSLGNRGAGSHVPFAPLLGNRARRLSVGAPGSELFGSFVGSFEESILSGRMSTVPSRPITFTARLGALGYGKCKSSLRCPPHIAVTFNAYYYQVPDYDSPSPYVGHIDVSSAMAQQQPPPGEGNGGSMYRIAQRGQIQVVLQNVNRTAVKLFLLPYDLSDMPANSRTILRQKHYSTADGKEVLRYAIQVQICATAARRYYVHGVQKVVFANRVPDGLERLKVVTQYQTPKYLARKPDASHEDELSYRRSRTELDMSARVDTPPGGERISFLKHSSHVHGARAPEPVSSQSLLAQHLRQLKLDSHAKS